MKYYLYLSKTKVEMLASQIPASALRGISAEFKASIGVLSSTVKTADTPLPDNVYAKSEALYKYLSDAGEVGSVANPKAYIAGTLPLRWGTLWDYASDLLFFFGTSDGRLLALIGASASAVGEPTRIESRHSLEYYSLRFLNGMLDSKLVFEERERSEYFDRQTTRDYASYMKAIGAAASQLPQEVRKIEFLARVLFVDQDTDPALVVATPLFAALASDDSR